MSSDPLISKSKYLDGLQCHKLVWFRYNAKSRIPPVSPSTQAIFDQGHLVGSYAKMRFPVGFEIEAKPWEFAAIEKQTQTAIKRRVPLFEAGFSYQGAFARFDILNPVDGGMWDLIEVKSSTEVKAVNFNDVAIQHFISVGAGLKIRRCFIYFINNQYTRKGDIDPNALFSSSDVTAEVLSRQEEVARNLITLQGIIRQKQQPDIKIGPHCDDPYECILKDLCWNFLPDHSVFTLYRSRKSFEWFDDGILELRDIPQDTHLSDAQQIQLNAIRSGQTHLDRVEIGSFLETLRYPLYFLDFETFNVAIPLFDGTRPYQRIPFQYSLHVVQSPDASPTHHSFLADGSSDPRPIILNQLRELLGVEGSIVCYNASFEKGVLRESSEAFTEYGPWYSGIDQRIVDLLIPFRSFWYYNPQQKGSATLKNVLPALTGKTYEELPIAEGNTASTEYLRVTYGDIDPAERNSVREQLEQYCRFDTEAMIWILEALYKLIKQ